VVDVKAEILQVTVTQTEGTYPDLKDGFWRRFFLLPPKITYTKYVVEEIRLGGEVYQSGFLSFTNTGLSPITVDCCHKEIRTLEEVVRITLNKESWGVRNRWLALLCKDCARRDNLIW